MNRKPSRRGALHRRFLTTTAFLGAVLVGACSSDGPIGADLGQSLRGRIVYFRQPQGCPACVPPEIWSAKADGTDARRMSLSLHYPHDLRVSPDGRWVLFEDWYALFLLSADGKDMRPVRTGLIQQLDPDWSPDGEWIVFVGLTPEPTTYQLYRVRPDGSDLERLVEEEQAFPSAPTYSPDGSEIMYIRTVYRADGEAVGLPFILDLETRQERPVLDTLTSDFRGYYPDWSPDGRQVAYLGPGDPSGAVWVLDLASGTFRSLGDARGNVAPRWSPDGSRLLYGVDELWTMAPDGSAEEVLLSDGARNYGGAWAPQ